MKKTVIFAVLLVAGYLFAFLYSRYDHGRVIDTAQKEGAVQKETGLPVLNEMPVVAGDSADNNTSSVRRNNPVKIPALIGNEGRLPTKTRESVQAEADLTSESVAESEPTYDDGIPDSYPMEDAEFYFVPREQRSAGNLGGPPPFNLPNLEFESAVDTPIDDFALPENR